jgi:hypothetical protein
MAAATAAAGATRRRRNHDQMLQAPYALRAAGSRPLNSLKMDNRRYTLQEAKRSYQIVNRSELSITKECGAALTRFY